MLNKKVHKTNYFLIFACFLVLFASGCTHTYKQPIHEVNLSKTKNKIDLPVRLVLTDEFRNAKWEKKSMGDTFILPIGGNLVHHTTQLVQNVFTRPLIPSSETDPRDNDIAGRYVLTPKVAFIEQSFGVTAFSEAKTSIGIEWNLIDTSGSPVWVETINGTGIGIAGNIFTGEKHQKKRLQSALQELFQNTQEAMLSSPLLRKLE
jgi:hypothetical protein